MQLSSRLRRLSLLLLTLIASTAALGAQQQITGSVHDTKTGEALQYANVWVQGSRKGTTTDREGKFTLSLEPGEYSVEASYIGYRSQTKTVRIPGTAELNFSLKSNTYEMPSVTVTPGDNPALRIIRKAIEKKEEQRAKLKNYSLTSHSKLLVRIEGALGGMVENSGNQTRITVSAGGDDDKSAEDSSAVVDGSAQKDSSGKPLPIILETQTDAWWAAPDRYKEVIKARKQSAMIPSQGNLMISQFFIVDFSADDFKFSDRAPVTGPISERGLSSYYYRLLGTTMLDSTKIYQIEISALSENDPLFEGIIYIADSTYALSMVDIYLNEAALPTFFSSLAFKQNFRLFEGEFWRPVDVVVDAEINIPIVDISIDIEGFSVLQDWQINQQINEDFFDRTRVKVLKEADERDSTYWVENAKIPSTDEEQRAYIRADSVKAQLDSVKYQVRFSDFLTGGTTGSDAVRFSFPGLLGLYRFNRIEGHALDGAVSFNMPDFPLHWARMTAGYGFNDERMKWSVEGSLILLENPTLQLYGSRFSNLRFIDNYNGLLGDAGTTISSMFLKYDPRDYYYRNGWSAALTYDAFFLFPTTLSVRRENYLNAVNNSDESLFRRDWSYRTNPPVNEGSVFSVTGDLSLDARDLIDNAGEIHRIGSRNHVPVVGLGWHEADLDGAQWNFMSWTARLSGSFEFGAPGIFTYRLEAKGADGALPAQMLYNLLGSMSYVSDPQRFRTLGFREFGGDRRVTAMFTYSFRDLLFRELGLPLLKSSGIELELFASGGYATMTAATQALQPVPVSPATTPFWEAGFGFDNILTLFRIDFGWRLNHFREGKNFFFGVNAGVLF